jgi:hypothetical protein
VGVRALSRHLAWLLLVTMTPATADKRKPMDDKFQEALDASGADYVAAEQALRDAGPTLRPVLEQRRKQPDATAQLLAAVLDQALAGDRETHERALEYLDTVGPRLAHTPVGQPPPSGVAAWLRKHCDDRVVELLTLRLVKATDWPAWRQFGVLLYLQASDGARHPLVTTPLIHFTARLANAQIGAEARKTLVKMADPALKLQLEAARKAHREWPPDLIVLEHSLK